MMSDDIIKIKEGVGFQRKRLMELIPDTETLLFVGKLYELDAEQLSRLMLVRFNTDDVVTQLLGGGEYHSHELQDYLISIGFDDLVERGMAAQAPRPPHAEILPEVWKSLEVQIADSIKQVGEKLVDVVGMMPGKKGNMIMQSMMTLNAKRPTIGDFKAQIQHKGTRENVIVLDVSGSMSEDTVVKIIADVVAMAWEANAYLVIVSSTATWWMPGEYDVPTVLARAEYAGTHYETLAPFFEGRDFGVVVTIADYDSGWSARSVFENLNGHIDQVLDISLVNRQTYLSEMLGYLADEVKPLLIADGYYQLG
jgi:MinD-like ATPase involved in chromosome partitioning or flagellar assembly